MKLTHPKLILICIKILAIFFGSLGSSNISSSSSSSSSSSNKNSNKKDAEG